MLEKGHTSESEHVALTLCKWQELIHLAQVVVHIHQHLQDSYSVQLANAAKRCHSWSSSLANYWGDKLDLQASSRITLRSD